MHFLRKNVCFKLDAKIGRTVPACFPTLFPPCVHTLFPRTATIWFPRMYDGDDGNCDGDDGNVAGDDGDFDGEWW